MKSKRVEIRYGSGSSDGTSGNSHDITVPTNEDDNTTSMPTPTPDNSVSTQNTTIRPVC